MTNDTLTSIILSLIILLLLSIGYIVYKDNKENMYKGIKKSDLK